MPRQLPDISLTTYAAVAVAAGLGAGVILAAVPEALPVANRVLPVAEVVGTLWVNALRMTVIPLIVPLLVLGVAGADDVRRIGLIGSRAILLFLAMLSALAILTALVAPHIMSFLVLDPGSVAQLRETAHVEATPRLAFAGWLTSLVPPNPFRSATDGAMLPVIVFTLIYAFALTQTAPQARALQLRVMRAVVDTLFIIVGWVIRVAPIGVFALTLLLGFRMGGAAAGALGFYIVVIIALHLAATPLVYLAAIVGGAIPPGQFARAASGPQLFAFSSRSSLATLPALITAARDSLRLPEEVTGLVLPLAVSVFKLTSAISWTLGAVFVARLYGIELAPAQLATVAAASVFLNATAPGIPSAGILVQAPVYMAVGLPVEGLGILVAIDAVPDMFKTAFNVTANLAVAAIVARHGGAARVDKLAAAA